MRLAPIYNTKLNTQIYFGQQSNNKVIERQVKQIMQENFDDMKATIIENSSKEINDKFLPEYQAMIEKDKGKINENDTNTFFKTLATAYQNAGLTKDAEILSNYMNKTNDYFNNNQAVKDLMKEAEVLLEEEYLWGEKEEKILKKKIKDLQKEEEVLSKKIEDLHNEVKEKIDFKELLE